MSKSDKPQFTRRDVKKLAPEILGHYHDMLMSYDVESFDKLLGIYRVDEAIRDSLRAEFTQYAETILRRRWRGQR